MLLILPSHGIFDSIRVTEGILILRENIYLMIQISYLDYGDVVINVHMFFVRSLLVDKSLTTVLSKTCVSSMLMLAQRNMR